MKCSQSGNSIEVSSTSKKIELYHPLVQTPLLPECEVCVVVPVRNEAQLLERCLFSLMNQADFQGQPLDPRRYEIILLANNCTDDSVAIARRFSNRHPDLKLHIVERLLPHSDAHIGRVRQILMDEAYHRLVNLSLAGLREKPGVIASTDSDSSVSPNWIVATLWEISQGADAIGGRITADSESCELLEPKVRVRYLLGDRYHQLVAELESYLDPNPHDCWPRHAQHYGASLAVTVQMYCQAGGMPNVRTPEDVAFYQALMRVGARFRHSPLVQVTTSARQTVRAAGGFAAQLNEWEAMDHEQAFLVESAAAVEARLQTQRQLRAVKEWTKLKQFQTFDLLFEHISLQQHEVWRQQWPLVDLKQAIAELNIRLQSLRSQHPAIELKDLHQLCA